MSAKSSHHHRRIQEFIAELSGFAQTAEETLKRIEEDMEGNKGLFSVFFERMVAIRGTAQQLRLPHIAEIAGLGEEIAVKGSHAESRAKIRRCVGALWDALTTVKYLLVHYTEETNEEQRILTHRLEETLRVLGGARPKITNEELEQLLRSRH